MIAEIAFGYVVAVNPAENTGEAEVRVLKECADAVRVGWVLDGDTLRAPAEPAAPALVNPVLAEIMDAELLQTPRRMAEAVLTDEGRAWLAELRAHIDELRREL